MKTSLIKITGWVLMATVAMAGVESPDRKGVSSYQANSVGWLKKYFGRLTYEQIVSSSRSPRHVAWYVGRQVRYRTDEEDEWADARMVIERGYGDCEDFAATVVELCKEKGFSAEMVIFFNSVDQTGHAIAVGEWNGQLWFSSDGSFATAHSWEGIYRKVARELGVKRTNLVIVSSTAFRSELVAWTGRPSRKPRAILRRYFF